MSQSFARDGRNLFQGNQIAGSVSSYEPSGMFRHSSHALENIRLAVDRPLLERRVKESLDLQSYLG